MFVSAPRMPEPETMAILSVGFACLAFALAHREAFIWAVGTFVTAMVAAVLAREAWIGMKMVAKVMHAVLRFALGFASFVAGAAALAVVASWTWEAALPLLG